MNEGVSKKSNAEQVNEWAEQVNEWAVQANKQRDERVAQYLHCDS